MGTPVSRRSRSNRRLGEGGGDARLKIAALGKERGEAGGRRGGEEALPAEEHFQGGEDAAAGDLPHEADRERERTSRLATGGVDEAKRRARGDEADRHAGLAKEPLEPSGGRGRPSGGVAGGFLVEVGADGEHLQEQQPGAGGVLGFGIGEGVGRDELFVEFGERDAEGFGNGLRGGGAEQEIGGPAEKTLKEPGDVSNKKLVGLFGGEFAALKKIPAAGGEAGEDSLAFGVEEPEDELGVGEDGRRNDETLGGERAEPGAVVCEGFFVLVVGHGRKSRLTYVLVMRTLAPEVRDQAEEAFR